jgi:hypothetical protein
MDDRTRLDAIAAQNRDGTTARAADVAIAVGLAGPHRRRPHWSAATRRPQLTLELRD